MRKRWGVVAGFAAIAQLLFVQAARAETFLAQAAWPPPLQPPMQPQPPQGPRVTLQSDNPSGRLQQFTPLRWQDVCLAPCGVTVDPAGTYRVGGGGVIVSESFTLPRASGEVTIDASVGSKGAHWAGLGLMIGGGVAAVYGALYLIMADLFSDIDANNMTSASTDFGDTVRNIGLLALGLGLVLEVTGIVLFSKGTSVQVR